MMRASNQMYLECREVAIRNVSAANQVPADKPWIFHVLVDEETQRVYQERLAARTQPVTQAA